ncbi:MAG: hypothetical protein CSA70_05030 [Rhodobacterales bacterium]|nr:MAG: hypothetical protein CSA70_05030 [Rhodobacterales bacterium]
MQDYLPKELREALEAARKQALRRSNRLRIRVGDDIFPVLKLWEGGFALDAGNAPYLRGLVDLYDGARHKMQCLVIASDREGDEMRYDFKRATPALDSAPLDFVREEDAPVASITRQSAVG